MNLRLKKILEFWEMDPAAFAKFLGISRSLTYELLNGKKGLTRVHLSLIAQRVQDGKKIDGTWLLTGEGEMLRRDQPEEEAKLEASFHTIYHVINGLNNDVSEIQQTKTDSDQKIQALESAFLSLVNAHQTLQRQHDQLNLRCEGLFAELGKYVKEFRYGNPYKGPMEDEIIAMQRQELEENVAELKEKT